MNSRRRFFTSVLATLLLITGIVPGAVRAQDDEPLPCPVEPGEPMLPPAPHTIEEPADIALYLDIILAYLRAGGSTDDLREWLLTREVDWFCNGCSDLQVADLTEDGYLDVLVVLNDDIPPFSPSPLGVLLIYGCEDGNYNLIYSFDTSVDGSLYPKTLIDYAWWDLIGVAHIGDMNKDGRLEIVLSFTHIYMGAFESTFYIVAWDDETENLRPLQAENIDFLAGSLEVLDIDRDGYDDLVIHTGDYAGENQGPIRPHTFVYSWDGEKFVRVSDIPDAPRYRIHATYDALDALADGDDETAFALFTRIISDDETLRDEAAFNPPFESRLYLQAFATYGILLTQARAHGINSDEAREAYQTLQETVPVPVPDEYWENYPEENKLEEIGGEWLTYGELFWDTAQATGDLHLACEAVIMTFYEDDSNWTINEDGPSCLHENCWLPPTPWYWFGYANPVPEPEQLCPF